MPRQFSPSTSSDTPENRHHQWFADFAKARVLPLLNLTVDALRERGITAQYRLIERDDAVTAELIISPADLPQHAAPPRLTVSAAPGHRLAIDYTGTFPHSGADGGFGAEIGYDTAFPTALDEQVSEFVRIATGT
jgi:hypothetical protein